MTETQKAVKRGVKLLDELKSNWFKKINLDNFDLGDSSHCVLGQNGGFTKQLENLANQVIEKRLGSKVAFNNTLEIDAKYYGFDAMDSSSYEEITQAWARVVRRRQGKKGKK